MELATIFILVSVIAAIVWFVLARNAAITRDVGTIGGIAFFIWVILSLLSRLFGHG